MFIELDLHPIDQPVWEDREEEEAKGSGGERSAFGGGGGWVGVGGGESREWGRVSTGRKWQRPN